jgi:hypothetical protein
MPIGTKKNSVVLMVSIFHVRPARSAVSVGPIGVAGQI